MIPSSKTINIVTKPKKHILISIFSQQNILIEEHSKFNRVFKYCDWIQKHMIYLQDEERSSANTFTGIFMTIVAAAMIAPFI